MRSNHVDWPPEQAAGLVREARDRIRPVGVMNGLAPPHGSRPEYIVVAALFVQICQHGVEHRMYVRLVGNGLLPTENLKAAFRTCD